MTGLDTNVLVRYVMQDDRADLVAQALGDFRDAGADFADALIARIAVAAGCAVTMTFDNGAAKAAGMTLVPV